MREITFRAKRILNGEWVYGSLLHYIDWHCLGIGTSHFYIVTKDTQEHYAVDSDTIGQYTGYTDKNGTKVFEGDIVKEHADHIIKGEGRYTNTRLWLIKYGQGELYAKCLYDEHNIDNHMPRPLRFLFAHEHITKTVVGNIYDNPELVEVGE